MLSGIGVEQLKEGKTPRAGLLSSAFAFVIGFSAVFITFGASASAIGAFLLKNKAFLAPIAGALIVLFGLHLIGWLAKILDADGIHRRSGPRGYWAWYSICGRTAAHVAQADAVLRNGVDFRPGPWLTRWLNRDVTFAKVGGKPGIVSGFLLGFAFALGWTPCIGPILTAVLAMAATRQKYRTGVILLACYSAGLAIPFLLTALGDWRILEVLSAIPAPLAHRRGFQRRFVACGGRFGLLQPPDMAFG